MNEKRVRELFDELEAEGLPCDYESLNKYLEHVNTPTATPLTEMEEVDFGPIGRIAVV